MVRQGAVHVDMAGGADVLVVAVVALRGRGAAAAAARRHATIGHHVCTLLRYCSLLLERPNLLFFPRLHRSLGAKVAESTLCAQPAAIGLLEIIRAWLALSSDVFLLVLGPLRVEGRGKHARGRRAHPVLPSRLLVEQRVIHSWFMEVDEGVPDGQLLDAECGQMRRMHHFLLRSSSTPERVGKHVKSVSEA